MSAGVSEAMSGQSALVDAARSNIGQVAVSAQAERSPIERYEQSVKEVSLCLLE